jgi:hypothetical protein
VKFPVKFIITYANADGSFDEVGTLNRVVATLKTWRGAERRAQRFANGRDYRIEQFSGDRLVGEPVRVETTRGVEPADSTRHDYLVSNHGTIYMLRPLNDAARQHLTENVGEEAQWLGGALAVEHRYIEQLVVQLRDGGWRIA